MDLKMRTEEINTSGVIWDCQVTDGIVPIVAGDQENAQSATIASFILRGSVRQLPTVGVPWTDFLTQKMTFGVLDFYIRDSLEQVGHSDFYPDYSIENDRLTMKVVKQSQEAYNEL